MWLAVVLALVTCVAVRLQEADVTGCSTGACSLYRYALEADVAMALVSYVVSGSRCNTGTGYLCRCPVSGSRWSQ